ncbi:CTIP endonuclease, partial [Amia calva]|nr:CTIP endonuclease [Amia calva]
MNSTGGSCGSPSSGLPLEPSCDLFKDLWARLKDCHDSEVQGLQVKINKLKKERCLDAQRLEEFYTKNQQLRELQKALQDNVKVLEDRLRAGLCDRCAVTEEHMRKKQVEFENVRQQNLRLITELMNERNVLQDENKKLCQQLEHLQKTTEKPPQAAEAPEQEEGFIPDSPIQQVSHAMVNKMRRKKDSKLVRYSERLPPSSEKSPPTDGHRTGLSPIIACGNDIGILVPETCEMDASTVTKNQSGGGYTSKKPALNLTAVVAETLGLGVPEESESQSVLGSFGKDISPAVQVALEKQDNVGTRQQSTDSATLKENNLRYFGTPPDCTQNREWLMQQRTSPVFGSSARPVQNPDRKDEHSTPVLGKQVKIAPLVNRLKSKTEDVPRIAPLRMGTSNGHSLENGEQTRGSASNMQMRVKDTSKAAIVPTELCQNIPELPTVKVSGLDSVKRKKSEEDQPFDRKNKAASSSSSQESILDDVADKPLDLSERLNGGRSQDRESKPVSKDRLKQATLFDMRKASHNSSLSLLKMYNGSSLPNMDSQEDPYLQEAIRQSLGYKTRDGTPEKKPTPTVFRVPATPPGSKMDPDQLFDIRTPDVQEPIRKKSRGLSKDCEQASVLQPNPCAVSKRSPPQRDDGKPVTSNMTWSLDPGADLSQYKTDALLDLESEPHRSEGETMDTDCTFISNSVLLKGSKPSRVSNTSYALGQKANDSLAEIFDRTAYGEYESCPLDGSPQEAVGQAEDREDEEEAEDSVDMSEEVTNIPHQAVVQPYLHSKEKPNASLNFPHVDVVRKKEQRKKLQGHTCKECEIYYADLPEGERQKKLSACSRHRFRYIPPSTPENFWEVGFPSTQTCVDRGYVKEDMNPLQRTRRRRPYNAMFSPKGKEQKT